MDVEQWDDLVWQANEINGSVTLDEMRAALAWAATEGYRDFPYVSAYEWLAGMRSLIECYAEGVKGSA